MTKRQITHRSQFLWFILIVLLMGACIKRQPLPSKPDTLGSVGAAPSASGEAAPKEPTGNYGKVQGIDVLEGKGIEVFKPQGQVQKLKVSETSVEDQGFDRAIAAETTQASANVWDVQLQTKIPVAVKRGDVLLATFHIRTGSSADESGEAETEFVFELGQDPYTKAVSYGVRASQEWTKVYVPFTAAQDYAPGQAQANFRLGYPKQRIEIGGVTIENFGKQLALADLPTTEIAYRGMSEGAAWRAAAAERIEKQRKGDLEVLVQYADGRPAANADVQIELARHEFAFGTAAPASRILDTGETEFRKHLLELFNLVTLENDLKWVPLAGEWGAEYTIERAQKAADELKQDGIGVRGHVLVWPGWPNLPKTLAQHASDKDLLRKEVESHIEKVVSAMKGRVVHWDVVNEPFDNHDLLDVLGEEAMVEWFKLARAADPNARLYINDFGILAGGGGTSTHRDYYEKTIRMLIEEGAPLDGIGMQGHFGTTLTAPEDLIETLDRFAKLGKPILVTEFDVAAAALLTENLAANYLRDFYTVMFSHPAVEGVVMWGFWDGSHWKNSAPLYRRDWSLKPAGEAYRKLVLEDWRTRVTGKTGPNGSFKTRGFLGEYLVKASAAAKAGETRGKLARDGSRIVIKL